MGLITIINLTMSEVDEKFQCCLNEEKIEGLIDVHAHLPWPDFDNDLKEVLEKAKQRGVEHIIVVSMDATEAEKIDKICSRNSDLESKCHAGFGLHPKHVPDADVKDVLKQFELNEKIVCVGECGLDSSPRILANGESPDIVKRVQRVQLKKQIDAAVKHQLPLNVHSRGVGHHTIDFIVEALKEIEDEEKKPKILMHSFDGKAKYAVNAVKEHGFYFSIPPSIVRDPQMAKMVKQLPLEHLVLESDSPSLGPVKQQRNEPANVSISCRAIALLKNLSVEQVAKQTNANA